MTTGIQDMSLQGFLQFDCTGSLQPAQEMNISVYDYSTASRITHFPPQRSHVTRCGN